MAGFPPAGGRQGTSPCPTPPTPAGATTMCERSPRPHGVHLVGSVPLPSVEAVLRAASEALGERLRRLPDGEIGERSGWLEWQRQIFARHPLLEMAPPLLGDYPPLPRARLRPGVT